MIEKSAAFAPFSSNNFAFYDIVVTDNGHLDMSQFIGQCTCNKMNLTNGVILMGDSNIEANNIVRSNSEIICTSEGKKIP